MKKGYYYLYIYQNILLRTKKWATRYHYDVNRQIEIDWLACSQEQASTPTPPGGSMF
jgi:hypothetical protein